MPLDSLIDTSAEVWSLRVSNDAHVRRQPWRPTARTAPTADDDSDSMRDAEALLLIGPDSDEEEKDLASFVLGEFDTIV